MAHRKKHRLAAILAIVIGLLSIKAGASVLLGTSAPTYPVLQWLVIYNVALGFVSLIAGIGLWMQHKWGITLATIIASLHGIVFITLISMFALEKTVAQKSIMAMLFRTTIWLVIIALLAWKNKASAGVDTK
jgi:FtsH-binding integral membrane protein